jgi:hypothetical protein
VAAAAFWLVSALCHPEGEKRIHDSPMAFIPKAPSDLWSRRCKISLPRPSFRTEAHAKVLSKVVRVAGSGAMVTDLQTKAEKYETKAAHCEESARQATEEPQRAFYHVLANYYGVLATDFRQVIEKRKAA